MSIEIENSMKVAQLIDITGEYHVARPDLWPANTVIEFTEKLRGKRIIGTALIPGGGQAKAIIASEVDNQQSTGGYVTIGVSQFTPNGGYYISPTNYLFTFTNVDNNREFSMTIAGASIDRTSAYDIWALYTVL